MSDISNIWDAIESISNNIQKLSDRITALEKVLPERQRKQLTCGPQCNSTHHNKATSPLSTLDHRRSQ